MQATTTKQEQIDHVWDEDLELELLMAMLVLWYGTVLKAVHTLVIQVLQLGPVPLDDPAVKRAILEARAAAVQIDATTKKAIAQRLADGASLGLTPQQIAYGTPDFAGIAGLFEATWNGRAATIARTELQKAQLAATVDRFRHLGRGVVDRVRAHDGDFDSACASRNGRTYPIANPPQLLHPGCRLTLSPVFTGEA
jgi:hypothetical protein